MIGKKYGWMVKMAEWISGLNRASARGIDVSVNVSLDACLDVNLWIFSYFL